MENRPNRIADVRQSLNLSQQELADLVTSAGSMKANKSQISKLERGDTRLSVEWLQALAAALGVEQKDLLKENVSKQVAFPGSSNHHESPQSEEGIERMVQDFLLRVTRDIQVAQQNEAHHMDRLADEIKAMLTDVRRGIDQQNLIQAQLSLSISELVKRLDGKDRVN